jgi:hypothetical protein
MFPLLASAESYLCVADNSVGFTYDKSADTWNPNSIKTDSKYLVRESNDKDYVWQVRRLGSDLTIGQCDSDFNESGFLFCDGLFYDFLMNKYSLRYRIIHKVGYVEGKKFWEKFGLKEGDRTPYMEIGKCSTIE